MADEVEDAEPRADFAKLPTKKGGRPVEKLKEDRCVRFLEMAARKSNEEASCGLRRKRKDDLIENDTKDINEMSSDVGETDVISPEDDVNICLEKLWGKPSSQTESMYWLEDEIVFVPP